ACTCGARTEIWHKTPRFGGCMWGRRVGRLRKRRFAYGFGGSSFRRHANGTIESNYFAIQHLVLEDVANERREFGWPPEPGWEGYLLRKRFPRRLGQSRQQWRVERTRRDRHDPDADAGEFARQWQRQRDDASFGRRVGGLADLSVERGNRGGAHDDSTLGAGRWRAGCHSR